MRLCSVALSAIILGAGVSAPAVAQSQVAVSVDAVIERAFRSQLRRAPTQHERLRYRTLMVRNGWTEQDVRRDLADRTDYRAYRNDDSERPAAAIRSAYQDILGRDPDPDGLRNYRRKMVREGWTEQDVRNDLRRSEEYASSARRIASADRIIRRAYLDVLRREPDPEGLATYRREILENGWEYHDLRQVLARSDERRENRAERLNDRAERLGSRAELRAQVSEAEAHEMVRRVYRKVLRREVDDVGLRDYSAKVMRDGWTEEQIAQALRESDEYRNR